jgi:hypothetical protein
VKFVKNPWQSSFAPTFHWAPMRWSDCFSRRRWLLADMQPKLPDWAVIDVTTPASGRYPGNVKAAGFFDEKWH